MNYLLRDAERPDTRTATHPHAALGASIALLLGILGCGDALTNAEYYGEPLASVKGSVRVASGRVPTGSLGVIVGWRIDVPQSMWAAQIEGVKGEFPASYSVDLLRPPPEEALRTDPETDGKLGFAYIFLYEDVNGDGEPSFTQDGKALTTTFSLSGGIPEGPDKFRGGSETVLLAYAANSFSADSRIGQALGTALEPGYHLVRTEDDCRCAWDGDESSWMCDFVISRCDIEVISMSSAVDLTVIDEAIDFAPAPFSNWIFPFDLTGTIQVQEGITCGSSAGNDCKGLLFIGATTDNIDSPDVLENLDVIDSVTLSAADLGSGKAITYELKNLPSGVYVSALLAEDGEIGGTLLPEPGDLVIAPPEWFLVDGTADAIEYDLELNQRWTGWQ